MSDSILEQRGNSLEEQFFKKQDVELRRRFKEKLEHAEAKAALAQLSKIDDDDLLESLLAINVNAVTLAALALYPMVAVAWADRTMEEDEKEAILKAAAKAGIDEGSDAYGVLESWLREKPGSEVEGVWRGYIEALKPILPEEQMDRLEKAVMSRAKDAARAAGGLLGFMSISAAEEAKLDELAKAFARMP